MKPQRWLVSWVGRADHEAAEGLLGPDVGPIASALVHAPAYDRIYLLTNYPLERTQRFSRWLQAMTACEQDRITVCAVDLPSPIDYAAIYSEVTDRFQEAGLPRDDIDLTFHLSPGTPAMAAIWIILAKTRFPAKLIQTSREKGLESVDFVFDLASDFLPEFLKRSDARIERLARGPATVLSPHFDKILHGSARMREQLQLAQRVAAYDADVLVLGETGTGKELVAEAIHAASRRASNRFVAVNCGALGPELANSELFGHVKGAFTGAVAAREGHFRVANGGTLFLDEVGDLPVEAQVRLLRALQAREVTPLGSSTPMKVDVRVIAATHRDLAADVRAGRFREDLFHRLAVAVLRLPPLRDREGDIELLVDAFLRQINNDARGRPETQEKRLSAGARAALLAHAWPGNIRELYHTLFRACLWSPGAEIGAQDVAAAVLQVPGMGEGLLDRPLIAGFDLPKLLEEVSRAYVDRALKQTAGRKAAAAKLLGFSSHQTLGNWMRRLDVSVPAGGESTGALETVAMPVRGTRTANRRIAGDS